MKRSLALAALGAASFAFSSCVAGPNQLSRTWDTHVNQKYSEDSWIHGALLQNIIPVYGFVGAVMAFGDVVIVNPVYFWGEDVWDRKGTAYVYDQVTGAERDVTGYKPSWMEGE